MRESADRAGSEPAPLNAFSVDVEDYFQVAAFDDVVQRSDWDRLESRVERNTRRLLELFDRFDVKATMFVLGWVAERFPRLICDLRDAGHELAIHGYDHRSVTDLTPEEFRQDVRKSKRIVEDLSGVEVVGYRAPNFSIVDRTLWALDVLTEEGFRYDSSVFPIVHDRYGIPDSPRFPWAHEGVASSSLWEFPISTVRLAGRNLPFVGGGYLRQFPMRYVRWGLRRLNQREGKPAVVYIHPWEIDPDQPHQEVGLMTRTRHYRNLDKTERRLEQLFAEFRFVSVRDALEAQMAGSVDPKS